MHLSVLATKAHRYFRRIRPPIADENARRWTIVSRIVSSKERSGWISRLFYREHRSILDEREIAVIYSLDSGASLKSFVEARIENTFGTSDSRRYLLTARTINASAHLRCPKICLVSRLFPISPFPENVVDTSILVLSKVVILAVSYLHPKMPKPLDMFVPAEMCLVGNEILSKEFVLRWLCYNIGVNEYVFDSDYRINAIIMMCGKIEDISLSSAQHLLFGVNDYSIKMQCL